MVSMDERCEFEMDLLLLAIYLLAPCSWNDSKTSLTDFEGGKF